MTSTTTTMNLSDTNKLINVKTMTNKNLYFFVNPKRTSIKRFIETFLKNYDQKHPYMFPVLKHNDVAIESCTSSMEKTFGSDKIIEMKVSMEYLKSKVVYEVQQFNEEEKKYFKTYIVKTLTGKTIKVKACSNMNIITFKECICDIEGIPYDQQRLCYAGMQLEDEKTLSSYNINSDSVIHLVLRLCGGMMNETSGKDGGYKPLVDKSFNVEEDL